MKRLISNKVRFRGEVGSISSEFTAVILLTTSILVFQINTLHAANSENELQEEPMRKVVVSGAKGSIVAEIADTDQLRVKGLLGKKELKENQAMLLDFIRPGYYAIHMNGMAFPIDAIWMDETGKILNIYENIQPNSPQVFPSAEKARYCLEGPVGSVKRLGAVIGARLTFSPLR